MEDPIVAGLKAEIDELRAGMIEVAQGCEDAINDIAKNTATAFATVDEALGVQRYIIAKLVPSHKIVEATAEYRAIREKQIEKMSEPSKQAN
jgi:hypothetical protein